MFDSDLSPKEEEEEEIIEKLARVIVKFHMDFLATLFLETAEMSWPLTFIGGQMATFMVGTFLMPIFGRSVYHWGLTFQKRENFKKLINRIEELRQIGKQKN